MITNSYIHTENTSSIKKIDNISKSETQFWGDDGFTFGDIIDAINPLQHIPVISTIYRNITGDDASTASKMVGGALFGGAIGFVASIFNSAIEESTGDEPLEYIASLFTPDNNSKVILAEPKTILPTEDYSLESAAKKYRDAYLTDVMNDKNKKYDSSESAINVLL